jgi:ClpP class serine protease
LFPLFFREFQTVTAGKYKRTITPFKAVTDEDYEKTKEQLESILTMFKRFVAENRPQLAARMDEEIATGEVWFGTDALKLGLCDAIKTADHLLTEYVDAGWEVYELEFRPPRSKTRDRFARILPTEGSGGETEVEDGVIARAARWVIRVVMSEMKALVSAETIRYLPNNDNISRDYVARYNGADRTRVQR